MIDPKDLILVDLTANPDPHFEKLLKDLEQAEILNSSDRNAKNYQNISALYKDYASFHLLINKSADEIVAFSGIQAYGKFARVATRTWYSLKYRSKVLARTNLWSEQYLIPFEVEKSRKLGFAGAFISMEPLNRRKSLQDLIQRLNTDATRWELLPDIHNTCRLINNAKVNDHISCWQNIALLRFSSEPFSLPQISLDKYKDLHERSDAG